VLRELWVRAKLYFAVLRMLVAEAFISSVPRVKDVGARAAALYAQVAAKATEIASELVEELREFSRNETAAFAHLVAILSTLQVQLIISLLGKMNYTTTASRTHYRVTAADTAGPSRAAELPDHAEPALLQVLGTRRGVSEV